jgi:hypothetical protein
MAINWEEAPEGTTHGTDDLALAGFLGPWRKKDGNKWYYYKDGEWVFRIESMAYLKSNPHLVERPALAEAPLPGGLVWPIGYTHYNPYCRGFFFNDKGFKQHLDQHKNWAIDGALPYWLKDHHTISRYGDKAPAKVAAKEQPKPKQKVGWWE